MSGQEGSFKHLVAIDCETTGLTFRTHDPSIGHQAVSWGIVVADAVTLKPVEELYVEIKWNEHSRQSLVDNPSFGQRAESIHGLTFQYLEEHGMLEEEAVMQIATLFLKYFGPDNAVRLLGHNVATFDLPFLRSMMLRHGIDINFGNRHYDSNSWGFAAFETYTSDELFSLIGHDMRNKHNALDDAKMALDSCRAVRMVIAEASK